MKLTFDLPLKATNSQNARLHWAEKARKTKTERNAVALKFPKGQLQPVIRVTLTRVGPRELDSDNLAAALKAVRDGVASVFRVDDGSKLLDWQYRQAQGEYSVRVEIESIRPEPTKTPRCSGCDDPTCRSEW